MAKPEPQPVPSSRPHPILPAYYDSEAQRRGFVRRLFDQTAGDYDRIERAVSFGTGAWYRRQALLRAGLTPGMRVLDVAVGTGLVAREALAVVGESGQVIGLDPSAGMLHDDGCELVALARGRQRIRAAQARGKIGGIEGIAGGRGVHGMGHGNGGDLLAC
jgi:demethylmenaquinone methyltransferase/2-methoxy-6-polyprenyl-1,4-benzoquinol methylase